MQCYYTLQVQRDSARIDVSIHYIFWHNHAMLLGVGIWQGFVRWILFLGSFCQHTGGEGQSDDANSFFHCLPSDPPHQSAQP